MIYISSDHGGFELKNKIIKHFELESQSIVDLGPFELRPDDDYPDYVKPLVDRVLNKPENMGILICRNGVGVCMAANRTEGIRAGLSWNAKHAASSRKDDNTNVLCLPADYIFEEEAINTVETWLKTPFSKEEKYLRRLKKAN